MRGDHIRDVGSSTGTTGCELWEEIECVDMDDIEIPNISIQGARQLGTVPPRPWCPDWKEAYFDLVRMRRELLRGDSPTRWLRGGRGSNVGREDRTRDVECRQGTAQMKRDRCGTAGTGGHGRNDVENFHRRPVEDSILPK